MRPLEKPCTAVSSVRFRLAAVSWDATGPLPEIAIINPDYTTVLSERQMHTQAISQHDPPVEDRGMIMKQLWGGLYTEHGKDMHKKQFSSTCYISSMNAIFLFIMYNIKFCLHRFPVFPINTLGCVTSLRDGRSVSLFNFAQ